MPNKPVKQLAALDYIAQHVGTKSNIDIARDLGVTPQYISKLKRLSGLPTRPKREGPPKGFRKVVCHIPSETAERLEIIGPLNAVAVEVLNQYATQAKVNKRSKNK